MLLTELVTDSSENNIQSKADHIEMLRLYIKHMENQPWSKLFISENNVIEELKSITKKMAEDDGELESYLKIRAASNVMAEFLNKHGLFTANPVVSPKSEAVLEEIQTTLKELLNEAHEKTFEYVKDVNIINSEIAYRANRKAIVYLYLIRSEWVRLKATDWKEFKDFSGDINRTIYWNQKLKHSVGEHERLLLNRQSTNELRHLRLLRGLIDNDAREVHALLKITSKQCFPNIRF